jgi:hypothetical protein
LAGQCFSSPRRSFPEASFSPGRKLALEKANHIRDELLRLIVLTSTLAPRDRNGALRFARAPGSTPVSGEPVYGSRISPRR